MKKFVSLMLCLSLIASLSLGLTGCGGGSDTSQTPASNPPAAETPAASEPAGEETQPAELEPVTLKVASSFTPTETGGQIVTYFLDAVTEASGGAITFDLYDGGTLCSASEEFDYLQDGSIDLCLTVPAYLMSTVPLAYGVCSNNGMEDPGKLMNYLLYENEETGALIEEQAAQNRNMRILGATVSGSSIIASSKPVNELADLANQTMGTPVNMDVYNALGVPTVEAVPPEMYDAISRGVYDGVIFAAAAYVTQSLYEVAPYVLYTGVCNSGQLICVNLDTWQSLSPEAQAVLEEAAEATLTFSAQCYEEGESQVVDVSKTTANLDDAAAQELVQRLYGGSVTSVRASSANLGSSEAQEVVLDAISEYLGFDVTEYAN